MMRLDIVEGYAKRAVERETRRQNKQNKYLLKA